MNWREAKQQFESRISAFLFDHRFDHDARRLEWLRYVNDICQLILAEKMQGDFLRLRAFTLGPDSGPIGGNLTRMTIQGPASFGGDYYWGFDSAADGSDTTGSIPDVLNKIALPWFGTICDQQRLRMADEAYPSAMRYTLTPDYFAAQPEQVQTLTAEYPLWTPDVLTELLDHTLSPQLESSGFTQSDWSGTWLRQRPPITDVFEVLPINHGVHVVCLAYNWVAELSAEQNGEFSPEARITLVGGALRQQPEDDTSVAIRLGTEAYAGQVIRDLAQRLAERTFPELASIATMQDFVNAIDEKQRGLLSAFGLERYL